MCRAIERTVTSIVALSVLLMVAPPVHAEEGASRVKVVSAGEQGQPIVARIDGEGTIHVVLDANDGPWYVQSKDGGAKFSRRMAVVDRAARKPGLIYQISDMVIGKGGVVLVAMSTNAWKLKLPLEEWGFFYTSLDTGATSFSAVQNINHKPSEGFSLATDGKGNVTACWLSGKLYANVSSDNGKTFGPTVEIDANYNPCNCCTTSATYGPDGKLAILYREETNDQRDMYLILWDQARDKKSNERISSTLWTINSCPMTYYSVARNQEGYTAAWPTKGDVYFARLDGQGKVLSPGEIKTPGTTGMRTGTQVLNAPDGSTLVVWKKENQLGWQLYDTNGRASGQAGSAPSAGAGAAGVVDKEGRFVLIR